MARSLRYADLQVALPAEVLGVLAFINGAAYLIISFTGLLFPDYEGTITSLLFPTLMGEVVIMLWLLIMGVKDRGPNSIEQQQVSTT